MGLALLLVVAVVWLWWLEREAGRVSLTVINDMAHPVALTLYGEGLGDRTYAASLAAEASGELEIHRESEGSLRLRVVHSRADIDAQLVGDVATLRGPQQLLLAPGNRYLIQPSPR